MQVYIRPSVLCPWKLCHNGNFRPCPSHHRRSISTSTRSWRVLAWDPDDPRKRQSRRHELVSRAQYYVVTQFGSSPTATSILMSNIAHLYPPISVVCRPARDHLRVEPLPHYSRRLNEEVVVRGGGRVRSVTGRHFYNTHFKASARVALSTTN
jgi:hypothetical protein